MKERREAIKGLQQYYTKDRVLSEEFESTWHSHLVDYDVNCRHRDVPDEEKVLFFGYSLLNKSNTRQYYDGIVTNAQEVGKTLRWGALCDLLSARFA